MTTDRLTGRTALVTGASRGIGRAIAAAMAGEGAHVVLVSRPSDALTAAARELRESGAEVSTVEADLADPGRAEWVAAEAVRAAGPIDLLVNNAAVVAPLGPSATVPAGELASALTLNVVAPMLLGFRLAASMADRGWGRIVNVSSGVAARPAAMLGGNVYTTAKTALEGHTLNLAAELDGTGVTANVYRPGMVDTAMQQWIRDQDPDVVGRRLQDPFLAAHANGVLITPEHSARALVRRLGTAATGQVWSVTDTAA